MTADNVPLMYMYIFELVGLVLTFLELDQTKFSLVHVILVFTNR